MNTKYLLIPALFATLAATASAQDGPRGKRLQNLDTNDDGVITREEAQAPHLERFASIDANNDGELTQAEMEAAQAKRKEERKAARFADADADGNGTLSLEEFTPEREAARFDRLDTNDDGEISAAELEATAQGRRGRGGRRGPRRGGNQ